MANPGRKSARARSIDQNRIVKAVFAAGEAMGITDRGMLEKFTEQVVERLRLTQPLPGMEKFVAQQIKQSVSESQLQAAISEILTADEFSPQARGQVVSGIKLSQNALRVLEKRYLMKDKEGKVIETPRALFRRVVKHIAKAELIYDAKADVSFWEKIFYKVVADLEFLPNSPTLMNAGRELGQLSACFVIPIDDSMESIFDAVKYTALIHKSGGGTGFSFSRLRPERDRVGSTGGIASGPISFMRTFDVTTDVIKQGGMRRGANMAILNVDHPDILKFITVKGDPNALTNFNLSVAVTDEFMEAVKKGTDYDLINPQSGAVVGKLSAKEVFDKIVEMAWRTGDPGVVFIDEINRHNPTPELGKIESTNPCGEQPLLPFESCNLGSINLSKVVTQQNGEPKIDYTRLSRIVRLAVHFLDDVIDVNQFPLPQIEERTRATRKIGLGVMGFADMLIQLGISYDSEQGLAIAEEVARFISEEANRASLELGEQRGVFPAFEGSVYDVPDGPRFRNATRTTVAPTGSLSIIANCSSGIEPIFALSYVRHILEGEELVEVNPYFEQVAKDRGFYSPELMKDLALGGKIRDIEGIPEDVKRIFVTAYDIAPEWHVKMQAAFQRSCDSAVSKTVNFAYEATPEDIANVYILAYGEKLKGITIYRDRSRESQVLTVGEVATEAEGRLVPRKRPKVTRGVTERVNTGCGYIYVTLNFDEHGVVEVFSTLGKAGGCAAAQLEAISRLVSLSLRSGVDLASVVKQLRGIRCPSIAWEQGRAVTSCADAIASVLQKHIKRESGSSLDVPSSEVIGNTKMAQSGKSPVIRSEAGQCPECGGPLIYQEGCNICLNCGFTKCG
ncbi:MAG: vitamin B12-dependent ribonucleotide reductase [Dehalococcoidales bacterium]|nr:vitamin B12-dependent ribonucleotide reductase [Dehalococcoidales bacterium]